MDLEVLWTVTLLILVAFIPTIAFMAWFRATGKRIREPWSVVILSYLFGAIGAIIIALVLEMVAMGLLSSPVVREYDIFALDPTAFTFVMVIVVAPIVEEAAKALGVSKSMTRALGTPRSGLVLGAAAGLGFAATENLLYEGGALMEGGVSAFIAIAVVRTFSSALMHASATSVSGYGIAKSSLGGGSWLPYYLLAVLMHASFNLFASFGELFKGTLGETAALIGLIFAFILVIASVSWTRRRISALS
ncbi:MAG: PrsW family intramembrane metalloprotease [Methanomassiliicoccales archaeon]|nr:PrsW family intramembrane metalloprotease [Methanomassiliicoccales archaeon]NYT15361.1 PrsW family intramembrane metalloprotease [Methanomassiliicoccales archaeon]